MDPVTTFLNAKAERTENALRAYLAAWVGAPSSLVEAVEYSLFAGGKRLRPALALGAAEIVSGDDEAALPAACALEMIHTYSLIHDDLPAMDDDDMRRGRPTCHIRFGEALAILAGDALLTMAFDVIAKSGCVVAVSTLARAAGAAGMVGGQVYDLDGEGKALGLAELRRLHACKTGALIRVSVELGAMLSGASDAQIRALTRYGEEIGLAFQIADDILNVTGTEAALGKPVGSDEARGKSTYPGLLGLDEARRLGREAVDRATGALDGFGPEADTFRALAAYIIDRDR